MSYTYNNPENGTAGSSGAVANQERYIGKEKDESHEWNPEVESYEDFEWRINNR